MPRLAGGALTPPIARGIRMDKRRMLQGLLAAGLVAGMGLGLAGCSRQQEVKLQGVDVTGAEYAKDFPLPDAAVEG